MSKIPELRSRIYEHHFDLIALTESWLTPAISDGEIGISGMQLVRKDRLAHGGGVLLYYDNSLICSELCHPELDCEDTLFCCIQLWNKDRLLVAVIYHPPNSDKDKCDMLIRTLRNSMQLRYSHVLIMGDFNVPDLAMPADSSITFKHQLQDLISNVPLYNHITMSTRYRDQQHPSVLDLVMTNEELMVEEIAYCAPLGKSDHVSLEFDYVCYAKRPMDDTPAPKRMIDFSILRRAAQSVSWDLAEDDLIERCYANFITQLQALVDVSTFTRYPKKHKEGDFLRSRTKKWLEKRNRAWHAYRCQPCTDNWQRYKLLRNLCNRLVKDDRYSYQVSLTNQFVKNPKKLYQHLNCLRKVKHGIPKLQSLTSLTETAVEAAEVLRSQYASVFTGTSTGPSGPFLEGPDVTECTLEYVDFTPAKVRMKLLHLRQHSSPGIDNIHPKVLTALADCLSFPLAQLFTKLFEQGQVPHQWKTAIISPIYKGGRREVAANYRPVALLPVISKVMESIVADELVLFLDSHSLLTENQHGFRRSRSTVTNLLLTREEWTKAVDKGYSIDSVFLDFSKAFDRVNHELLLCKLRQHGIRGLLLSWFAAYLQGRSMCVRIGGQLSATFSAPCGVPQGSVLGPRLFLVYIDDLSRSIDSNIIFFADDVKVWRSIRGPADQDILQQDLDRIHQWSHENVLPLNIEKCKHISFRREPTNNYRLGNDAITRVTFERDLGVIQQQDLGCSQQSRKAASKASSQVGLLRRVFGVFEPEVLPALISLYVRPHIEYAIQAWQPWLAKDQQRLETPQRRATKQTRGMFQLPYVERLKTMNMFSVAYRRFRADMILTYQIMHDVQHVCRSLLLTNANLHLRGHPLRLQHQPSHLNCRRRSFSVRICEYWNKLPAEIVTAPSIECFKTKLDEYYGDRKFHLTLH